MENESSISLDWTIILLALFVQTLSISQRDLERLKSGNLRVWGRSI